MEIHRNLGKLFRREGNPKEVVVDPVEKAIKAHLRGVPDVLVPGDPEPMDSNIPKKPTIEPDFVANDTIQTFAGHDDTDLSEQIENWFYNNDAIPPVDDIILPPEATIPETKANGEVIFPGVVAAIGETTSGEEDTVVTVPTQRPTLLSQAAIVMKDKLSLSQRRVSPQPHGFYGGD